MRLTSPFPNVTCQVLLLRTLFLDAAQIGDLACARVQVERMMRPPVSLTKRSRAQLGARKWSNRAVSRILDCLLHLSVVWHDKCQDRIDRKRRSFHAFGSA
jgi:hypothetical protein